MDQETNDLIKNEIENNEVCLFMKGTPDAPQCGFSMATSNILKVLEVNFKGINVLADQKLREGIKVYSDWPTIPQLYVKNEFVGGGTCRSNLPKRLNGSSPQFFFFATEHKLPRQILLVKDHIALFTIWGSLQRSSVIPLPAVSLAIMSAASHQKH